MCVLFFFLIVNIIIIFSEKREILPAGSFLFQRFATRRAPTEEMEGQQKTGGGREGGGARAEWRVDPGSKKIEK